MRLSRSAAGIRVRQWAAVPVLVAAAVVSASAQPAPGERPTLRVVSAAPTGELAALAEANEIRVVFSEPMVTLGSVPARVTAPFFSLTPAIPGSFRWSGTTILIFTPDAKRPLPYATRYDVTIAATATAVSGRRLSRPYQFGFLTPTVKLLNTNWYRRGGRAGAPMVVMLRFNQPVRAPGLLPHLAPRSRATIGWNRRLLPKGSRTSKPRTPRPFKDSTPRLRQPARLRTQPGR